MEKDFYISLIYKELKKEISSDEQVQLDAFYKASPDNLQLRDDIGMAWRLSQPSGKLPKVDVLADLKKVKSQLDFKKAAAPQPSAKVFSLGQKVMRIAAALLFLVVAGYFVLQFMNKPEITRFATADEVKNFQLEDGTNIWLNKNSSLELSSADFNESIRNVKMTGEAFFDVKRNENAPFVISTSSAKVTVLGTSFSVNESSSKLVEVNVTEGKVSLAPLSGSEELILVANEKGILNLDSNKLEKGSEITSNNLAWKTGKHIFRSTKLSNIILELKNNFGFDISLENKDLNECSITAVINTADGMTVLRKIAADLKMEIQEKDANTFVLLNGECY